MSFDLRGLQVLVTRPKPFGYHLCEAIEACNGKAFYLPTIEIVPIQVNHDPEFYSALDWLIFVSPQAVLYGAPLIRNAKIKLAAIGESTANALRAEGFTDILHPSTDEWTSEGLLKLPDFQALAGKKIALVKGLGGRELLAETLAARGAKVTEMNVYQRILPSYDKIDQYLDLFRQQKIDIIVCTSGESLQNLITIMGVSNQSLLFQVPVIVVSPRLVELAKELGWKKVFLAANASHNAIIDTLKGNSHVRK